VTGSPTKADEIALVLEQAIMGGELSPGTVLRQEQLSEEFGVSRTPIREALRQLAALGLVSIAPNRGVRVRLLSRGELQQTYLVRTALESFAAELARERITAKDLRRLERAERRFAGLTRDLLDSNGGELQIRALATEWVHANGEFHDAFIEASGASQLVEAARNARRVFQGQAIWSSSPELTELYSLNVAQHRGIVEAFRARDPRVRSLVETHLLDSSRLIEQALDLAGYGSRRAFADRVSWASR
jgi:DNA-binding GntR family transcriptional regulator